MPEHWAEVSGNGLIWNGKKYSVSGLVALISRIKGFSIPSEAYRGPIFWENSKGISIKSLWEQYLNSLNQ